MAIIQDGRGQVSQLAIENKTKGARTVVVPRGTAYSVGATAVIPTASAAGSTFFSMRNSPTNVNMLMFIERISLQLTTTTAFTTQLTAGRRIAVYRGSTATPSGGTAITPPSQKDSTSIISQAAAASGGDIRICAGSAISTTNVIYEAQPFREGGLAHIGAAGSNYDIIWEFHPTENSPLILQSGQLLGIRNPQAFDAAGVVVMTVNVDWHESVSWNSTTAD